MYQKETLATSGQDFAVLVCKNKKGLRDFRIFHQDEHSVGHLWSCSTSKIKSGCSTGRITFWTWKRERSSGLMRWSHGRGSTRSVTNMPLSWLSTRRPSSASMKENDSWAVRTCWATRPTGIPKSWSMRKTCRARFMFWI